MAKRPTKKATKKQRQQSGENELETVGVGHTHAEGLQKLVRSGRKVVYDTVRIQLCAGNDVMSAAQAKELLGWEEETDKVKFGNSHVREVSSMYLKKVRCHHNVTNRPIHATVLKTLTQEHLRRRWRLNGEPIIIGKTGLILNGQHSLLSLILAAHEWKVNRSKWEESWPAEPTMEKLVVFGIDESDEVVNTMDTCKPRSLAEVIFRSAFFDTMIAKDRRPLARMTDYAIRMLWHRTGASLDAFAPRRTHAESLGFLQRHPRVLECVKHIYEEESGDYSVTRYLSPGYASAFLYMMGCSATDPSVYREADPPREEVLDWKLWETACDFWVLLTGGSEEMQVVHKAFTKEDAAETRAEHIAVIAKAWTQYATGKPIADNHINLVYHTAPDGMRTLAECPTLGGIDIGDPSLASDSAEQTAVDPSPAEIQKRAAAVRRGRASKDKGKRKGKGKEKGTGRKGRRTCKTWAKGDTAWVREADGDHYFAMLTEDPQRGPSGQSTVNVQAGDGLWDVPVNKLSLVYPK